MKPEDILNIELGLVNKCTLNCRMCLRREDVVKDLEPNEELHFDTLIEILEQFPNLQTLDLVGSISEPTLYSRFIDLVSYAKARDLNIRLSTNGDTFKDTWWEKLGRILDENDIVRFPVDGSTQELHSRYRVNSNLERTLNHHRALKSTSKAVTILQNIIFKYNENDSEAVYKIFKDENFNLIEYTHTGEPECLTDPKLEADGVVPVDDLLRLYKMKDSLIKTTKDIKITCNSMNKKQLFLNHMGVLLPCDDTEEMVFDGYDNSLTIYNSTLEELMGNINSIIDEKEDNDICKRCCSGTLDFIRDKYPIVQYNRADRTENLHEFRSRMRTKEEDELQP